MVVLCTFKCSCGVRKEYFLVHVTGSVMFSVNIFENLADIHIEQSCDRMKCVEVRVCKGITALKFDAFNLIYEFVGWKIFR
jgi:hypothetical protein